MHTLYLDVDGVVCPFSPEGHTGWGSRWRRAQAGLLPVSFAPELVAGLNSLARTPGLRCVWLTSWEELAPQYLCPAVGLAGSNWPYLAADGAAGGNSAPSRTTSKTPDRIPSPGWTTSWGSKRKRSGGRGSWAGASSPFHRTRAAGSAPRNLTGSALSWPRPCFDVMPGTRTIDKVSRRPRHRRKSFQANSW